MFKRTNHSHSLMLMSGKGGSGKTTLALAFASFLSNTGHKVLLVDCDTATHGLTYFFENKIDRKNTKTLFGFLLPDSNKKAIRITENIDFIPSIIDISDDLYIDIDQAKIIHEAICHFASDLYDVVIYDCQAGYTPLCQVLANNIKTKLSVLELDAISVAANRVLFRQLCLDDEFIDKGMYQVINKLDSEDKELYAKIKFGTLYDNLQPITFNWSIRRAFSEGRIPKIGKVNARFTSEIGIILRQLLPELSESSDEYIYDINQEYLLEIDSQLNKTKKFDRRLNLLRGVALLYIVIANIVLATSIAGLDGIILHRTDYIIYIISITIAMIISLISIYCVYSFNKKRRNDARVVEREMQLKQTRASILEVLQYLESTESFLNTNFLELRSRNTRKVNLRG